MPGLVSTMSLQTVGLKSICIFDNDISFEFESKDTLGRAKRQINRIYFINNYYTPLLTNTKKEVFAFSISFEPREAADTVSIFERIQPIVARMPSGRSKKNIPIITKHH